MMPCTCRVEIDREPYGNGYAERETHVMCDACKRIADDEYDWDSFIEANWDEIHEVAA